MRVFRYFDATAGLATLQRRQLRLADPLNFNDPFELTPRVTPADDDLVKERLSSDHLINNYYTVVGRGKGLDEKGSREEYLTQVLPVRIREVIATKAERAKKLRFELIAKASSRFRLLCCNLNCESILMWSHYADKHRGIVLEIETDELIPGQCIDPCIIQVRYRTSPPTISALERRDDLYEAKMLEVIGTKALQWSYEEEVRILFPLHDQPKDQTPIELQLDPMCIKRVIVGCNLEVGSEWYRALDGLADDAHYSHTEFQRAYIHPHDYKLCFASRPRKTQSQAT